MRPIPIVPRVASGALFPASMTLASSTVGSRIGSIRYKRYSAFDADLDKDALAVARRWHAAFDPSQLPSGTTTYARSSGPGGQHVNKLRTETKAISVFPVKDILAVIPPILHPTVRMSPYYTAGSDALTFQAQSHRSRTANADENRKKLASVITQLYDEKVPAETGSDKHAKYKEVVKRFHDSRLRDKKLQSSRKQSRRGGDM
ncbi:peptidyl-tRNA hydrolase domain protein [Cordyceps militaris CM01]|uniref:Peptidyl-tRNA hydrolase domain protein n=1 Tax=Cordyceps militaris (strain CM01) TaxID=983644 RepID=G3J4D9_CORMM|nr:peptidyl-tRNA hydrolase domain protein [Cordyceps militaris CM01]EGX96656.1 peptidyl-tRNA hydrolase domain protein [Cordyceps militaris CM01]